MFSRILYPTDFSDVSKKALEYVKNNKGPDVNEVIVLHVIDKRNIETLDTFPTYDYLEITRELEARATEEITSIVDDLTSWGFKVKAMIEKGIPLVEILRVAEAENVDGIIIGSHGKSNLKEMLMGSVSEKVIRKATVPVLVVKR